MIKELQTHPFARPLFVWMAGILLQAYFQVFDYAYTLLVAPVTALLFSFYFSIRGRKMYGSYTARWVWGALFLSLLLFLSIQVTAYSLYEKQFEQTESRLVRLAKEEQLRLLKPFAALRLTNEEMSVLTTITLGNMKEMDRDVRKRFSATGVAHILSVSGFHVAVVCGFLTLLFSFLPRSLVLEWTKYVLAVGLLWGYVAITGLAAAAVRSGLMLTLFLTGRLLRRTTDSYNILAASAFCMLVYEPLYLFDIGFQLSYLAVFFILYLQPRLQKMIDVRNPLLATPWGWITVTLAAQVGTTFLCLYYFGQFSTVFLLTNVPVAFIATLLIPSGVIWMLLPTACPGYDGLQEWVEWLTRLLWWVVDSYSRVPYATLNFRFSQPVMLAAYGILFSAMLYAKTRKTGFLFLGLILLLIIPIVQKMSYLCP